MRNRIYHLLDYRFGEGSRAGFIVTLTIQFLIISNVLAVILESVASIRTEIGKPFFRSFEVFSLSIFLFEYLLRIWSIVEAPRYAHPFWGRLRFALTPMALVDLAAISPIFFTGMTLDPRFLRLLRVLRLFRIAKVARYTSSFDILGHVLYKKRYEFAHVCTIFGMMVILSGALAYFAEGGAQPEAFANIPAALWWAIITFTTVGYGDVVPVTITGKILASVTSILGITMFALVAGVLVTGFLSEIEKPAEDETAQE